MQSPPTPPPPTVAELNAQSVARHVEQVARAEYWNNLAEWGYPVFFIVFAIAAGVLLLSIFLPDGEMKVTSRNPLRLRLRMISGIILLMLCVIGVQTSVDRRRGFIADQDKRHEAAMIKLGKMKDKEEVLRAQYLYMPEGKSLAYMTLGNTGIAADYVWLSSQQYVSNSFRRGKKFDMLLRFFNTMMELDPNWTEAGMNAGKVLSALEKDRYKVEEFYIDIACKNPDDWRIPYEGTKLFVVPPLNPDLQEEYTSRAEWWLQRALKKKNLPPSTQREMEELLARLSMETNSFELAEELLLKSALDTTQQRTMRIIAARDWLQTRSMVIVQRVQKRIDEFKKTNGKLPDSILPILAQFRVEKDPFVVGPNDAYGFPLDYKATTGKVTARGLQARRAIQSASVVNSLLLVYENNKGSFPENLKLLDVFTKEYFDVKNPPSSIVIESIGKVLDVENSPMGKPWDYDNVQGLVILPPESEMEKLFRNVSKLVPDEE